MVNGVNLPKTGLFPLESTALRRYHIRDAKGKLAPKMHKAVYGDLQGHDSDFLVFKKDSIYQICDSRGRCSVKNHMSTCGEFSGIFGQFVLFEKGNNIYTYDKNFKQVGHPQRKLS